MTNRHLPALVALATCVDVVGREPDDLHVIEALRRRDVKAVHVVWNDPGVDWSSFGLVVVRSTWDYSERRDEFLAWAEALPKVLNPAPLLRWNTDKRYLDELAKAGLPVIPTRFLAPGDGFEPPPTAFVLKPAVSCGAKDTARYAGGDREALRHVRRLQAESRTVLVQPYLSGIEATGETAILFIGGGYSHSIRRGALLQAGASPDLAASLPLNVQRSKATGPERALADQVMRHLPCDPAKLLYARVDMVPGPEGEPMILEVELTEPALFLAFTEGGADRMAEAIVDALE